MTVYRDTSFEQRKYIISPALNPLLSTLKTAADFKTALVIRPNLGLRPVPEVARNSRAAIRLRLRCVGHVLGNFPKPSPWSN